MEKLVILLFLLCSCSQWVPQEEEQDISEYRYDVPSEETEDGN